MTTTAKQWEQAELEADKHNLTGDHNYERRRAFISGWCAALDSAGVREQELRDLITGANENLSQVHSATKDILQPQFVGQLVAANEQLLKALRIIRDSQKEA